MRPRPALSRRAGRTRLVLAIVGLALAATVASGCGVVADDEPRALAISTTTTEPLATPTSGGAEAVLYYVQEGKLSPVDASLPNRRLTTVLDTLLQPLDPVDRLGGLGTSIPVGTELLGLQTDGDTVTLDLSDQFENVVGTSRQQAFAQLVMTATEFPDVSNLRFRVEGTPIQVTSPTRGDTATVSACDFASFLPTAEEAEGTGLDPADAARLNLRRSALELQCPAPATGRP